MERDATRHWASNVGKDPVAFPGVEPPGDFTENKRTKEKGGKKDLLGPGTPFFGPRGAMSTVCGLPPSRRSTWLWRSA